MSDPRPPVSRRRANLLVGVHGFALLTAGATFVLIFVGGLVTSTGSGLAVPDWPLAFGQVFPPMVGGVLYEHGHRLTAALVGLLTAVLAVWIWVVERRAWVRGLAVVALLAILVQGVLGGLTVLYLLPMPISVAHALLAQMFFCLTVALTVVTGPEWARGAGRSGGPVGLEVATLSAVTVAVVFGQLILGAVMRHTGAGLAIPDFPLAFGRLIPPLESEPVLIHFLHRVGAVAVMACVAWTALRVRARHRKDAWLLRPTLALAGLLLVQLVLGALTIWTQRGVLVTTAHVAGGAGVLAASLTLTLRALRSAAWPSPVGAREAVRRQVPA